MKNILPYFSKLDDLDKANQYSNWYWTIRQLRNYSLGNSLISQEALKY